MFDSAVQIASSPMPNLCCNITTTANNGHLGWKALPSGPGNFGFKNAYLGGWLLVIQPVKGSNPNTFTTNLQHQQLYLHLCWECPRWAIQLHPFYLADALPSPKCAQPPMLQVLGKGSSQVEGIRSHLTKRISWNQQCFQRYIHWTLLRQTPWPQASFAPRGNLDACLPKNKHIAQCKCCGLVPLFWLQSERYVYLDHSNRFDILAFGRFVRWKHTHFKRLHGSMDDGFNL